MYPTALSPPRRPASRTPQAQNSTTPITQHWVPSPQSINMMESLEAVRSTSYPDPIPQPIRHITPSTFESEPSPIRYPASADPSTVRHAISPEWLKRKPSSSGRIQRDSKKDINQVSDGPILRNLMAEMSANEADLVENGLV
ncbi:MAG: hypothetical protein TREMPRED_003177 [Tremellales sp. Tagirdzhanova-0007]|nr:MAG: hypothetical protein TREMPRED_003177 [Tremellales sp. Tagirdzhanova-0007]